MIASISPPSLGICRTQRRKSHRVGPLTMWITIKCLVLRAVMKLSGWDRWKCLARTPSPGFRAPFQAPLPSPVLCLNSWSPPFAAFSTSATGTERIPASVGGPRGRSWCTQNRSRRNCLCGFHCPPSNLSRACEPQTTPSSPPHESAYPGCALHHPCDHRN